MERYAYIGDLCQHVIVQAQTLLALGRELADHLWLQLRQLFSNFVVADLLLDDGSELLLAQTDCAEVVNEGVAFFELGVELILIRVWLLCFIIALSFLFLERG
jgi:hypothetical protein